MAIGIGIIVVLLGALFLRVPIGCIGNPYFRAYQECITLENKGLHSTRDAEQARIAANMLIATKEYRDAAIAFAQSTPQADKIVHDNPGGSWTAVSDLDIAFPNEEHFCAYEFYVSYSGDRRSWVWLVNPRAKKIQFGVALRTNKPPKADSDDSSNTEPSPTPVTPPYPCLDGTMPQLAPHDPRNNPNYVGPEHT
jgi:hypothetical protein